jgi:hypothetical protein
MDKLEEQIRNNRENLNKYDPSSDIWEKIRGRLRRDRFPISKWLSIAAMIVIVLGTVILFFRPGNNQSAFNNEILNGRRHYQTNPQFKETEVYYNNLVNSLYTEATPLLTGNPEIKKELTTDISQLDSICSEIKNDLKDNIDNQEVVEALIQNYRIKIRLLEDMLTILKEDKNNPKKIERHEL